MPSALRKASPSEAELITASKACKQRSKTQQFHIDKINLENIPTGWYYLNMKTEARKVSAKEKILNASLNVIRTKGYSATTVDDLCAAAGVTKGAFFHHFESKEALGVASADYWSTITSELFANASYHQHKDPLDRFLAYIDFRRELVRGEIPEFSCLVGTMVQEAYESNPAIRSACQASIFGHAATLVEDIAEAKKRYAPKAKWQPESLALHTQAVLQGAFILAKAKGESAVALDSIDHLYRYIDFLFQRPSKEKA